MTTHRRISSSRARAEKSRASKHTSSDRTRGNGARFDELRERLLIVRVHELPEMPDFSRIDRVDGFASVYVFGEDLNGDRFSPDDHPRRGPPVSEGKHGIGPPLGYTGSRRGWP